MKYLIGVDIGTTGTKASLYDIEGREIAGAFRESVLRYPREGWVEQDPQDFYTSACGTISEMVSKAGISGKDVAAITVDGQMAGVLGIDGDFKPVICYDSWLDRRCARQISRIREQAEELVLQKSGLPTMVAHCGKILWWKEERPGDFKRISKFIQPAGYVSGRFAGLKGGAAFIDPTYCHFSGLFDFSKNAWSEELCAMFDIPAEKLPRVIDPWEIVGELTPEAARDCGLTAGIPVTAGCGDQAAGFLGAGLVEPGCVVDVAGTASVFACGVDRFQADLKHKTLLTSRSVFSDLWFPHAFLNGGGLCLRWFRDNLMKPAPKKLASAYGVMDKKAEALGREPTGVLFLPHLGGRNFPFHQHIRGSFANINWNTDDTVLYKSVMEGIAYEYSIYLDIERSLYPDIEFKEVRTYGGGAKSRLFTQIKADVLGIPYVQVDRSEVGALGCAILGGYAVGIYKDMAQTAKQFTHTKDRIPPDEENHRKYRIFAEAYTEYGHAMEKLYERMNNIKK
jgi:xylulokinase